MGPHALGQLGRWEQDGEDGLIKPLISGFSHHEVREQERSEFVRQLRQQPALLDELMAANSTHAVAEFGVGLLHNVDHCRGNNQSGSCEQHQFDIRSFEISQFVPAARAPLRRR